jgi:SWI/SNF-related matrix-associated actin-dependent regulator 1 of chromatin subfamily A
MLMGLFSKKPKASSPATPAAKAATPTATKNAKAAKAEQPKPEKAPKPAKGKKITIDPVDFLAMRTELQDLRARLEASEQSKAIVETRLAALDATTTAIANSAGAAGADEVRMRINEIQVQLGAVAEAAANANANAENAAAKATAAATVATNAATSAATAPAQIAPIAADPELMARVDALAAQVQAVQAVQAEPPAAPAVDPALAQHVAALAAKLEAAPAPGPDAGLLARLDQLSARLEATPELTRLIALETRVGQLAAAPAPAPAAAAVDPQLLERVDQLAERVAAVDQFGAQLAQLNARVSAQAEFGVQLSSLRDRIAELNAPSDDRRVAALAATGDADLRDRVNAITDRLAANDAIAAQIAELAERVAANDATARQATEQVGAIEQRLQAVSTELANQVSELGRDIDGLAAHRNEVAGGTVSDELLDGLKSAQVKLAAEQARYEIAFRQDLAALAEQVRHTRKP